MMCKWCIEPDKVIYITKVAELSILNIAFITNNPPLLPLLDLHDIVFV